VCNVAELVAARSASLPGLSSSQSNPEAAYIDTMAGSATVNSLL
jgi:hypothetical protein